MTQQPAPPSQPSPQQPAPPPYQVVPGNGPATAAMVLGIVGVVLAMIPILGLFALPLGVLAIVFGAVGLRKHGKETPKGKGAAITGLVLGVLCFALAIFGMTVVNDAMNEVDGAFEQLDRDLQELEQELGDL